MSTLFWLLVKKRYYNNLLLSFLFGRLKDQIFFSLIYRTILILSKKYFLINCLFKFNLKT